MANGTYIVSATSEGQGAKVKVFTDLKKAAAAFRKAVREDSYYSTEVSMHFATGEGEAEAVKGWRVTYQDGEFHNGDLGVTVNCWDHPKGKAFSPQKLAPLFPKVS